MPKQTLRSVRGRKPYVEAFPALDALVLGHEHGAGRPCCQWTNEAGLVVGHIEVQRISEDEVTIRSHFLGAVNVGRKLGRRRFALRHHRPNENYARPSLVCPDCGRTARFLFMVAGHWSCRSCHDLTSVSQLLGDVTKYLRRLQELTVLLRRGRKPRTRLATFAKLEEEYWQLRRDFEGAPSLPEELSYAQYPEWVPVDDPRLKQRVATGEQGYGWSRFAEGGFRRLAWRAEQELKRRDEAELRTRDQPAATTVRPLWATGPSTRHAPFAPGHINDQPTSPADPVGPKSKRRTERAPKPFRFDPEALNLGLLRGDE